jgi:hypothetical protein
MIYMSLAELIFLCYSLDKQRKEMSSFRKKISEFSYKRDYFRRKQIPEYPYILTQMTFM